MQILKSRAVVAHACISSTREAYAGAVSLWPAWFRNQVPRQAEILHRETLMENNNNNNNN